MNIHKHNMEQNIVPCKESKNYGSRTSLMKVFAVMALLGVVGCSSDKEEGAAPQPASAESTYPDINSVPTERPQPTILDLFSAPQGLQADQGNATHSEAIPGGPTSSAEPPPPAPPPPTPTPSEPSTPPTP